MCLRYHLWPSFVAVPSGRPRPLPAHVTTLTTVYRCSRHHLRPSLVAAVGLALAIVRAHEHLPPSKHIGLLQPRPGRITRLSPASSLHTYMQLLWLPISSIMPMGRPQAAEQGVELGHVLQTSPISHSHPNGPAVAEPQLFTKPSLCSHSPQPPHLDSGVGADHRRGDERGRLAEGAGDCARAHTSAQHPGD